MLFENEFVTSFVSPPCRLPNVSVVQAFLDRVSESECEKVVQFVAVLSRSQHFNAFRVVQKL